ncbi:isocitrate dehydrogenase [NAD] subunit 1, mitochondrial [Trichoderma asperellum]|uniref:Isocitrate dehydrogenase [NAD] subunit 1, mitochondrial n=1 Tax=Trichoderma asperellum TaxID=101201 RepID=A0A6V8R1C1_TRIAP|nr:isocitrate dehydrogenase [NAD] subunit 1, mitochondrial [Trichoderma asperellum]
MLSRSSLRTAQVLRAAAQPQQLTRSFATVQSDIFKPAKFGGKYTVTLIPGDGIGGEVAESVKTIFKADNVPIEWEQIEVSGVEESALRTEEAFRESVASLKRNKLGLKGILHTPVSRSGHQSFNVAMRQELDIYASISLIKNIPGYETRHKDVDLCIIRENTEGEYSGLEHQSVPGVVESLKIITRAKSERIAKFAFAFALANGRKKVTCIHKANIMKLADGLFRSTFHQTAKEYPTLEVNDMIVDNASMQAVSRPQQFDVMVMPNLYGGILSNIGAALVGGPGIVPGCNMGREVAVFEPGCRHVGLDIKGKDQANPTAMILSGSMLLRHLGLDDHANRISKAVYGVIADGYVSLFLSAFYDFRFFTDIFYSKVRTRDMGGESTTHEFTKAILDRMETI